MEHDRQASQLLVLDPTAFAGGSKVATGHILSQLSTTSQQLLIATCHRESWTLANAGYWSLWLPAWLARRDQGLGFFMRHLVIAAQLLWLRVCCGRIDVALGASGPGVDLALYLVKPLLGFKLVQLIHGPVAASRTIGRCLLGADEIHCLETSRDSLASALARCLAQNQTAIRHALARCRPGDPLSPLPQLKLMTNGLPTSQWPSACRYRQPRIFWAASLLKWKGLDLLVAALRAIPAERRPAGDICYIQPHGTALPLCHAPSLITRIRWHKSPEDLDSLRAGANIFISTSDREPFGLSILEAMAAGHCIVLPADGAYWDHHLVHDVDCIKYRPGDAADLAVRLQRLTRRLDKIVRLGLAARQRAKTYRAEACYAGICRDLSTTDLPCCPRSNKAQP